MVVALGSHYQRLFIIPSLKAVIVRQGSDAKFFGRAVSAASAWANGMRQAGLTCSLVWQTMGDHGRSFAGGAGAHEDSARMGGSTRQR